MNLAVFPIILITLEMIYQLFMKMDIKFKDKDEDLSQEEFQERIRAGEWLVVIDDLVLDVSKYARYHPGGMFLI